MLRPGTLLFNNFPRNIVISGSGVLSQSGQTVHRHTQAGVYVAWHPVLDTIRGPSAVHRVGYAADLAVRLHGAEDATTKGRHTLANPGRTMIGNIDASRANAVLGGLGAGWSFRVTFETGAIVDARFLRNALLYSAQHYVVPPSESNMNVTLLSLPVERIVQVLQELAAFELLFVMVKQDPTYELPKSYLKKLPAPQEGFDPRWERRKEAFAKFVVPLAVPGSNKTEYLSSSCQTTNKKTE